MWADPAEQFESVEIEITGPDGKRVSTPVVKKVIRRGVTQTAELQIPAASLRAGSHEVAVRGVDGDAREDLAFVSFEVVR